MQSVSLRPEIMSTDRNQLPGPDRRGGRVGRDAGRCGHVAVRKTTMAHVRPSRCVAVLMAAVEIPMPVALLIDVVEGERPAGRRRAGKGDPEQTGDNTFL